MRRICLLGISFTVSGMAVAGDLDSVISDLYGGDGITLTETSNVQHIAHFAADSSTALNSLNTAVIGAVGFTSFNSTVTGVTFDIAQGIPVASDDSLGPLLSERATTMGEDKLDIAFSYTRVKFDQFEGIDLDDLTLNFIHPDCCTFTPLPPRGIPDGQRTGFEIDSVRVTIDLQLKQDVLALFGNYGLTDRLDLGIVVPIVSTEARAHAHAEVVDVSGAGVHSFAGQADLAQSSTGGTATGIGDVIARAKYNFVNNQDGLPDIAFLTQITLPTGDEDDLLGSGETKYRGMLIASERMGLFNPHVNLAYELSTGPSEQDNWSYAAGADIRIAPKLTLAADLLGRYYPDQNIIGDHLVDVAIAAKWNPFNDRNAPFSAYAIVPVNDDEGLRADVIWGVGMAYTF